MDLFELVHQTIWLQSPAATKTGIEMQGQSDGRIDDRGAEEGCEWSTTSNQLLDNRHTGDPAMGVNEFQMPHALLMVSNEQRLHSLTTTLDQGPLVGVLCIIVNRSLVPS